MCWAAQPPQLPNQRQNGAARSELGFRTSIRSARRPASRTRAFSPGKAPETVAPLSATPSPRASRPTIDRISTVSSTARRREEFPGPRAAEHRRANQADEGPALRRDACADVVAGALERLFASDPALDDLGQANLELRLDQTDEPGGPRRQLEDMRQNKPLRNEAHVADDCARRLADQIQGYGACVDAFERPHARVRREAPVELPAADVDRHHHSRAAAQQHVGKSAGRGADVEAGEPGRIEPEGVERGRKLQPAARDIRMWRLGFDRGGLVDLFGGLANCDSAGADEACSNRCLRPRPARKEAALHENDIGALAHGGPSAQARLASASPTAAPTRTAPVSRLRNRPNRTTSRRARPASKAQPLSMTSAVETKVTPRIAICLPSGAD